MEACPNISEKAAQTLKAVPIITIKQVCQNFGSRLVLSEVSFELYRGEIVGLIGANGAGKTTLLNIMAGFLRPKAGSIQFHAIPTNGDRAFPIRLLLLQDRPSFIGKLTVKEVLLLSAEISNIECESTVLTEILVSSGLEQYGKSRTNTLSMGLRQRLNWAHALLLRPEVLLLDEPSAFLDPLGVIQLRTIVSKLAQQGTAILMSSHNMHELLQTSQRFFFLNKGRLGKSLPVQGLTAQDLERNFFSERQAP